MKPMGRQLVMVAAVVGMLAWMPNGDNGRLRAQPEPLDAADRPGDGAGRIMTPDESARFLAAWKAYHAGLFYSLRTREPARAREFASRVAGMDWDAFHRQFVVPREMFVEMDGFKTRLQTLRAVVREAVEIPEARVALLAFEFDRVARINPSFADMFGDSFASTDEVEAFSRQFAAEFYDTWGSWLGLLTPEKVRDAMVAQVAYTYFPADPRRKAPEMGQRKALETAGVATWEEFERGVAEMEQVRSIEAIREHAAQFETRVVALRQLALDGDSWRAMRENRFDAVDLLPPFSDPRGLATFAEWFAERFGPVWAEWTSRFSRDAAWCFWQHFHAGRLAGLMGMDDTAGRRFAEAYAGVPYDQFRTEAPAFSELRAEAVAWGEQAAILRHLFTQPSTAEAMRAGRFDEALAAADATARHLFADGARLATFCAEFQQRFPKILKRWADGITAAELRAVLVARAAYALWTPTAELTVLDASTVKTATERLTGMTAEAWMHLASAHPEFASTQAEAEAFGHRAALVRRLLFHLASFRRGRAGGWGELWADPGTRPLFASEMASFEDFSAAPAMADTLEAQFPDLVERWRTTISPEIYVAWWTHFHAGMHADPRGRNENRAADMAAAFFGAPRAVFDRMVSNDTAHLGSAQITAQLVGLRIRTLRDLAMNPATFGAARRNDFHAVWEIEDGQSIALRENAFRHVDELTTFAQQFAGQFPEIWREWIGEMTPDLAWACCRVYVAGLHHRSDSSLDDEFARDYVRHKLQLDWAALRATDFRIAEAEAARLESQLDLHVRRVFVLRELMCHRETREWMLQLDLRAALTHPVGLELNLKHRAFARLAEARPVASLFRLEFPDIWFGWRMRISLDQTTARQALECYWVGFRSPPEWPGVSAPQARRALESVVGVSSRAFHQMLDREPWGEALRDDVHRNFSAQLGALKRLLLGEDTGALARSGRFDDLMANENFRRLADPFRTAGEIEQFAGRFKQRFAAVWYSWTHATASPDVRGQLAWELYWVYGLATRESMNAADAQRAIEFFTGRAFDEAVTDPALTRHRSRIGEYFAPRLRLLRQLMTDDTTREFVRAFDFVKIARGGYLVLHGRAVFADATEARQFAREFRDKFPDIWDEWLANH